MNASGLLTRMSLPGLIPSMTIRGKDWYASRLGKGHEFASVQGNPVASRHYFRPDLEFVEEVPEQAEDPENAVIAKMVVRQVVRKLPQPLRLVIVLRFGLIGEPMTLESIAVTLGVNQEQVRLLESDGLTRLRGLV